ncbi:cyclic nucleotide-binding domain-containing protein [Dissulfurirhabdus thermomarina]|uniref:Cyclic nucleotide-binding domain-containing protein n=1 Tax=Dissulfurirhabdus thermomarina TaxID=1765737 RepID=A0A6N9TNU4_DISTH|nr:cyclic nucleotide-binding domain-containing protein [Dissulfurirhabdus thermomarina]NDY42962.1 cyclic nucleotide-binding domain-containing protein [Dissulfurirhabdus thermomarina]NMX24324.1 cyclic nucleotide-binding domain-containing protein [Dissulfurirhabdus thermomarina]
METKGAETARRADFQEAVRAPRPEGTCLELKEEMELFRFLAEAEADGIYCYFERRDLEPGEALYRENEPADFVAFILSGRVKIVKETEFKGHSVVMAVHGPGSFVGEFALVEGTRRCTSAVAMEPTRVAVLHRDRFDELAGRHPDFALRLLKTVLRVVYMRLRGLSSRLTSVF